MKILIVEDEVNLAIALKELLEKKKYFVDAVNDGLAGLQYAQSGIYDLIILDIMLPKKNGIQVLKTLREKKMTTPILMLSAKDEVENKVTGLDCGADDYVTKPFSTEELLARIRALLRRKGEIIESYVSYGNLNLDFKKNTLETDENKVKLHLKEFQIFELLISNPEQIISKDRIIEKVWGSDSDVEFNNVEVYISFLRKKMQFLNASVCIQTARGVGYSLESISK
ncbi:MAG TPA: response regulator transcription factor [Treponemataceae bacterium]|nr:response regulator transcription factor [Treponemataceae bacterium]